MAVGVSWLSQTSTNTTFFPKPPTTFLTGFSRGERRKYAGNKVRLKRVSNSQPPGHECDTLTTESSGMDKRQVLLKYRKKKRRLLERASDLSNSGEFERQTASEIAN